MALRAALEQFSTTTLINVVYFPSLLWEGEWR